MTEYEKKWEKHIPEESREHFKKARAEMREAVKEILPEGFLEHRQTARREMLLAMRGMLDQVIKKLDEKA
jgi:hypothetical protein